MILRKILAWFGIKVCRSEMDARGTEAVSAPGCSPVPENRFAEHHQQAQSSFTRHMAHVFASVPKHDLTQMHKDLNRQLEGLYMSWQKGEMTTDECRACAALLDGLEKDVAQELQRRQISVQMPWQGARLLLKLSDKSRS